MWIADITDGHHEHYILSTCRPRGQYGMDEKKSDNSCQKKYKGHPSLLPGVFTVYCPHGNRNFFFSPTLRNIYKKTAWCTTLRGENAVNFLCTPK
jgi:hypothetical protein